MDLDHYKIESMKAVSEGKCLIVGFALTAFKDITWYLYCTAPITHTCKIIQTCSFRPELSVIPLFHISLLKEQGQKERYEAGTKKKPQECLHKLSWHVALCKILTHLSIHFWDSPTAISHWGNHFSSLGTLTVKSAAHKKLHCSQLCLTSPWLQAPGLDMPPTRNQNALAFPKCFISLLCLELVCTSQKNLVSSVLEDKPWHFKRFPSCRNIVTIYHPV